MAWLLSPHGLEVHHQGELSGQYRVGHTLLACRLFPCPVIGLKLIKVNVTDQYPTSTVLHVIIKEQRSEFRDRQWQANGETDTVMYVTLTGPRRGADLQQQGTQVDKTMNLDPYNRQ